MKDFEKMKKYLQRDFELMMALYIIFSILALLDSGVTVFFLGVRLIIIILFGFGIYFAKNGKIYAGIFGIIISILMMLSNSIISLLLGAFMLIHSIIFLIKYDKLK